ERAEEVPAFPKPGTAGQFPSLDQLDGDSGTEIAAGSSPADSNVFTYDAGAASWSPARLFWPTVRGDYARTGTHGQPPPPVLAAVGDLRVLSVAESTVVLVWSAPGGVGPASLLWLGAASTSPIDQQSFDDTPIHFSRPPFIADNGNETLL